jgi:hypothetical protein
MIGASPVAMPVQPANLLPVMKSRTLKASDDGMVEKMRLDVNGWGVNEIRKFMLAITVGEMQQQIALDNPPAFSNVDGVRGRGLALAQRRLTVSFGTRLKVQALNSLKNALMQAISRSTKRISGTLSNPRNWTYRYVRNGHVTEMPIGGSSGIPMGPDDFIVLMPTGVTNDKGQAYATAVNMRVAGGGKLSFRKSARSKVRTSNQGIGFLALASRAAQATGAFAGFSVTAGFTKRYALHGEVTRIGGVRTGFIKIRANTGRYR